MLADLRAVCKIIQPVGSLQSGIPLPALLPKDWPITVMDLQNCFFPGQDREKFAFIVPICNNAQSIRRYHWNILPQVILNIPTLCQYFVNQPLEAVRK